MTPPRMARLSPRHARSSRLARAFVLLIICVISLLTITATPESALAQKLSVRADRALREGDFEQAEKLYREQLSKDASDKGARLGLSLALLKGGKIQDAFDHAARVVASDPLSARAHALLGSAVLAAGDFRMAVEEFRTALSLKDNDALAIAGMAMVNFYENRLDESTAGLRRAVFLDPREPDYVFNLAIASARAERYKEAADAYERFLIIAPRTDADRRARIHGLIDFLRYLGNRRGLYDVGGAERVDIPFEAKDGRPVINVRVNGMREPMRFVLDTGSGMCVISDRAADQLGLKPVALGGTARGFGGGGRFEIVYSFLNSIEIGGAKIENVPVYIRRFYDEKNTADGYIGISAVAKFLTVVDYGTMTFTLVRQRGADNVSLWRTLYKTADAKQLPEPFVPPPGIKLRTTSSGFLSSEVNIEGIERPLNFIVDTGASVSVISQKLAEAEEITRFAQANRMKIFGAAGIAENVGMLLLPRIQIGNHAREKVAAAVLDLDTINETAGFVQTGVLGGNFLRQYRVTFDFQRSVLVLEPIKGLKQKPDNIPSGNAVDPLQPQL